jgi:hypothetical protein
LTALAAYENVRSFTWYHRQTNLLHGRLPSALGLVKYQPLLPATRKGHTFAAAYLGDVSYLFSESVKARKKRTVSAAPAAFEATFLTLDVAAFAAPVTPLAALLIPLVTAAHMGKVGKAMRGGESGEKNGIKKGKRRATYN